jgi:hypothetical protein
MTFRRPDAERALGEIPSLRIRAREAQREPVERLVILAHDCFRRIGGIRFSFGALVTQSLRLPVRTGSRPARWDEGANGWKKRQDERASEWMYLQGRIIRAIGQRGGPTASFLSGGQ